MLGREAWVAITAAAISEDFRPRSIAATPASARAVPDNAYTGHAGRVAALGRDRRRDARPKLPLGRLQA